MRASLKAFPVKSVPIKVFSGFLGGVRGPSLLASLERLDSFGNGILRLRSTF